jgi:hypothetical protein
LVSLLATVCSASPQKEVRTVIVFQSFAHCLIVYENKLLLPSLGEPNWSPRPGKASLTQQGEASKIGKRTKLTLYNQK